MQAFANPPTEMSREGFKKIQFFFQFIEQKSGFFVQDFSKNMTAKFLRVFQLNPRKTRIIVLWSNFKPGQ